MTISKNIIDRPLQKDDTDKLSMDKYTKGLQNFIENSNTPMTISIQGEWGSGKTSLMNKLEHGLLLDLIHGSMHSLIRKMFQQRFLKIL